MASRRLCWGSCCACKVIYPVPEITRRPHRLVSHAGCRLRDPAHMSTTRGHIRGLSLEVLIRRHHAQDIRGLSAVIDSFLIIIPGCRGKSFEAMLFRVLVMSEDSTRTMGSEKRVSRLCTGQDVIPPARPLWGRQTKGHSRDKAHLGKTHTWELGQGHPGLV